MDDRKEEFLSGLQTLLQQDRAQQQLHSSTPTIWTLYTTQKDVAENWEHYTRFALHGWASWNPAQWSLSFPEEIPQIRLSSLFATQPFTWMMEKVVPLAEPVPMATWQALNNVTHFSNEYVVKPVSTAAGVGVVIAAVPVLTVGAMLAGPYLCYSMMNLLTRRL